MHLYIVSVAFVLCSISATAGAQPAFPAAADPPVSGPIVETRFGITTTDPFRRLEDVEDPEVQAWMKAEADRTRATLDSIPGRPGVLRDIERLVQATTSRIEDAQVLRDGRVLVLRKEAGDDIARLLLLDSVDAAQGHVLVDPEDWRKRTGKPHAINHFTASPDGRHLAVGVSTSGTELADLHVLELDTGKPTGESISRVRVPVVQWLRDGSGFTYNRLNALAEDQPANEQLFNSQVYLHRLGSDADEDPVVFGNRQPGSADVPPETVPVVVLSADGDFMLGLPFNADNRKKVYIAPVEQLGGARIEWKQLIERDDNVRDFDMVGNDLYLITASLPGRAIERIRLPDGRREVIVEGNADTPISEGVFSVEGGLALRKDALYYITRAASGVGSRLHRLPHGQDSPVEIPLPGLDDVSMLLPAQEGVTGLVVIGTGWTRFPEAWRIDADGNVHASLLQPQPEGVDSSRLVSRVVQVPSHDGVEVPLSIVHRSGMARDGRNPTLLQGYGAYGASVPPVLVAAHFAYFERGFIRAFCHVRGGGEKGEAWHKGGFQATKSNTWKDFNACARYLVDNGYTSPSRLAALGVSAGGILVGNAMVEQPDLYRVVLPLVGVLDGTGFSLRAPGGAWNAPEFGDPDTEAGYRSLHAMSSYFKVADGTGYPAVMLVHGVEDPRVPVWQSNKMAARLQQASSSGLPVLLRLDYDAGHGIGNTQGQANSERADLISFMLWQFGEPGFQPAEVAQDNAGDSPMTRDISNPDESSLPIVHGDLAKGNADMVVRFPAGSVTPHHWHTTAERMVLLSGELHLTYDGHNTLVLKPGSYAYGPAKLAHTAACTAEVPCVLFIATELPFDEVLDLAHMDADRDGRVSLTEFQDGLYDFDAMDRDRDQALGPDELPGWGTTPISRAGFRARLARGFKAWDHDGDGHLDAHELAAPPRHGPASASTGD